MLDIRPYRIRISRDAKLGRQHVGDVIGIRQRSDGRGQQIQSRIKNLDSFDMLALDDVLEVDFRKEPLEVFHAGLVRLQPHGVRHAAENKICVEGLTLLSALTWPFHIESIKFLR